MTLSFNKLHLNLLPLIIYFSFVCIMKLVWKINQQMLVSPVVTEKAKHWIEKTLFLDVCK